jgi:hypothetical protein
VGFLVMHLDLEIGYARTATTATTRAISKK